MVLVAIGVISLVMVLVVVLVRLLDAKHSKLAYLLRHLLPERQERRSRRVLVQAGPALVPDAKCPTGHAEEGVALHIPPQPLSEGQHVGLCGLLHFFRDRKSV